MKNKLNLQRFLDLLCGTTAIIIFSPLMIIIYLILKISREGHPIFQQERIGFRGVPFTLYKFRTMIMNSEEDGIPKLCRPDDHRLTCFGKFMRNYHLDELPQLWNVIKGDMSIVGPRPERQYFIDQIVSVDASYIKLYNLRPGLFSMATLYNGYTYNMNKMLSRLEMDLHYLNNQSIWLDIKIICLTCFNLILGKKF